MKKKLFEVVLATFALTVSTTMVSFAGQWKKDNIGWWWQENNGSYPVSQWKEIDNDWYYFNSAGYMVANQWRGNYYLGADGAMLTDCWTPDGYYVGADGEWIPQAKKQQNGGLEEAPYKAYLDSVLRKHSGRSLGLDSDTWHIQDAEWEEYDDYYTVQDVYLATTYEFEGLNVERLAFFDELRIRKDGDYTFMVFTDGGTKDIQYTIEDWINECCWPKWELAFDNKGYVVAFHDGYYW